MSSTAHIPKGWALFSADFSRQARGLAEVGGVVLIRDVASAKAWVALDKETRDVTGVCVAGEGATFELALQEAIAKIPPDDVLTTRVEVLASSASEVPAPYNGPWNGLPPIDGVDMARFYGAAASYRAAGGRNARKYAWLKLGQFISETVAAARHPASEQAPAVSWDGQQAIPHVNMARLQQVATGYRTAIGRAAKKLAWRKLGEFLDETLVAARKPAAASN